NCVGWQSELGATQPARAALEDEAESHARGERRQDCRWLQVAEAGRARDRLGRVAVADVEQVEIQPRANGLGEADLLLGAKVDDPDIVFPVRVHRLDVEDGAVARAAVRLERDACWCRSSGDRNRDGAGEVQPRLGPEQGREAEAPWAVVA